MSSPACCGLRRPAVFLFSRFQTDVDPNSHGPNGTQQASNDGCVRRFSATFIPAKTDGASCLTPWTGGRYGKDPFKSSAGMQFHPCLRAAKWLCKPPHKSNMQPRRGEVAEWLKAPHSKCGIRATVSGVRILSSPPSSILRH